MAAKKFRPLHFVERGSIHSFLKLLSSQLEALPNCRGCFHFHLINTFVQVRYGNLIVEYYDQSSMELFIENLTRILNTQLSKLIQRVSSTRFLVVTNENPCFLMDIKITTKKSLPFTLLWYGSVPWKIQIICKQLHNEGKMLTPSGVVDLSNSY